MPIFNKKTGPGEVEKHKPAQFLPRLSPAEGLDGSRGISQGISAGQSHEVVSSTSRTGTFAGTFQPYSYIRALQERIKQNWSVPQNLATESGVVFFRVDHTGSVSGLTIKESSGSPEYDRGMLNAVLHSVPLPPLVASAPNRLPVEFTFDERLLKGANDKDYLAMIVGEQGLALERNPSNCEALIRRGKARMHLHQFQAAIADYRKATEISNENVEAYLERAKCYLYIDEFKNALADCRRCIQLAPSLAKPYTLAGAAELGQNHIAAALAMFDKSVALSENDPEAWALRAHCNNLALRHEAAIADAGRALAIDPDYSSAYAYRGDAYEAIKDYDAALRDYTRNVELEPKEVQSYMRRTELYTTIGQYDNAVFDATEAIKLAPKNGEAYYYRANANEELGLKAQAKRDLDKAKQLGI